MSHSSTYANTYKLSLLKFSGADTKSFLQGQLTNDVNSLNNGWQFSGYCNPKGRLLALLQIWENNDAIYALIDTSLVEATVKRLRMYVMRSKVQIEVLEDIVLDCSLDTKNTRFAVICNENTHTLEYGNRALIVDLSHAKEQDQNKQCNTLEHNTGEQSSDKPNSWELSCIEAGEPTINASNLELFVPQMVNLDLLDGINFKKGCYTGQEIVARMHYLGKLKQRMFVCELINENNNDALNTGEKITAAIDSNDDNKTQRNAGNIVSFSQNKALAVLRIELINAELTTESGVTIKVCNEQPYEVSSET